MYNKEIQKKILDYTQNQPNISLDSYYLADKWNVHQRSIRKAISDLCGKLIIFVPEHREQKGFYVSFDENNDFHQMLLSKSVRIIVKQIKTMYFKRVVRLLPIIKDEQLKKEIGQTYLLLQGETNEL